MNQKHENIFSRTDLEVVAGSYNDDNEADRTALYHYLNSTDQNSIEKYTGTIEVQNGQAVSDGYTMLHARSVAEEVRFIGWRRSVFGYVAH